MSRACTSPCRHDQDKERSTGAEDRQSIGHRPLQEPVFHDQSKHIDVRYHFLRECVEKAKIVVSYTTMKNQLADLLTKALGRTHFQELRSKVGVQQP
jgi:hypothetical protein